MKVDLVEYAKGICGQMDELTKLMADAASKLEESAPSASTNTGSPKFLHDDTLLTFLGSLGLSEDDSHRAVSWCVQKLRAGA